MLPRLVCPRSSCNASENTIGLRPCRRPHVGQYGCPVGPGWAQGAQTWISWGVESGEKLVPRANGAHHEARAAESVRLPSFWSTGLPICPPQGPKRFSKSSEGQIQEGGILGFLFEKGGGQILGFTSGKIACTRTREAHIQVRSIMLYRNS